MRVASCLLGSLLLILSKAALRPLRVLNLLSTGTVPYAKAWEWQRLLLDHHIRLQDDDQDELERVCGTILVLEHSSVYTLGTGTKEGSGPFAKLLADGTVLNYELFNVERAGEATYHGPGQIVVYPILDLSFFEKDINRYLRGLEEVVINSLADVGIPSAGRIDGLTGVWVGDQKLAALGIKLRRWVTMHGVSVNVCPDMRYFSNIVPCGIKDKGVGSIVEMGNADATVQNFAPVFLANFAKQYNARLTELEGDCARQFMQELENAAADPS